MCCFNKTWQACLIFYEVFNSLSFSKYSAKLFPFTSVRFFLFFKYWWNTDRDNFYLIQVQKDSLPALSHQRMQDLGLFSSVFTRLTQCQPPSPHKMTQCSPQALLNRELTGANFELMWVKETANTHAAGFCWNPWPVKELCPHRLRCTSSNPGFLVQW